jgi:hypothetical protein
MKQFLISALLLCCTILGAQVPKKIIVEHFTNTKCSICANKNPGFYTNLSNHPGILHLAIHPSSPYTQCLLSQQSLADSDARTNYYGLFGSTPKFVINGSDIPTNTDYSNASMFTPFQGQTSPLNISIKQHKYNADSIKSTVTIKAVAAHGYTTLRLFGAIAEDTVFYTSQNGETHHYDVFRKALWSAEGITINVPSNIGDSITYTTVTPANPVWNFNRIYTLALIQVESNNEVIQAEAVPATQQDDELATGINNQPAPEAIIYPNPTKSQLTIQIDEKGIFSMVLLSSDGKTVASSSFSGQTTLNLPTLPTGLYAVVLTGNNSRITKRIIVE